MKLFVWDFHGVLEMGTEKAVHQISNYALHELGYETQFSKELCDEHYGKKWYRYFQALMPTLSLEKCLELQKFCHEYSEKNPQITEQHIVPNPQAKQVLQAIAEQGHRQILISNAQEEFLMRYVNLLDLGHFFDRILANNLPLSSRKADKVDLLEAYLAEVGDLFEEIIAIDDLPDNLSFKRVSTLKFCLYRHAPPFPTCAADYFTHQLEEVMHV